MIIVVTLTLRRLANHCANTRAGRTADNRALQAAAKDRPQHRAAGTANQRTFARPDPALIATVIVMIIIATIVIVVITAAPSAVAHAVVVRTLFGRCAKAGPMPMEKMRGVRRTAFLIWVI